MNNRTHNNNCSVLGVGWFCLDSLFNGILVLLGYLILEPSIQKNMKG